jgi:hypothetical protein
MTELEELKARLASLEQRLQAAEQESAKADDYRQITNAMMGHVYSYYNHSERKDLEDYWVQSRDDIVYAHNDRAYTGKQGVWEYYIDGTDANKKRYANYARSVYHVETPDGAAAGYRVIHVLGSPYIEIAADRKTAQGIWMSFSFMSNMGADGIGHPSYVLQRFSGEFLREDDKWRLWHIRDYTDVNMQIDTPLQTPDTVEWGPDGKPVERMGPPVGGPGEDKKMPNDMPPPAVEDGELIRKMVLESANTYQPWTHTVNEPYIPRPYDQWDPQQSYIRFVPEHQKDDFIL